MRIALAQMPCQWGGLDANLCRMAKHVQAAASKNADLIAFPEITAQGMWKDHLVRLAAEPLDGPVVTQVAQWAKTHRIAIGFGLAERTPGKPYNGYVLIDRTGRRIGVYRKNYVTRLERPFFRPDHRRPVFQLGRLRLAVAICWDSCHPELLASYARRGAQLVLLPHAWDADPLDKAGRPITYRDSEHMVDCFVSGRVVRHRTHDEMLADFERRISRLCRTLNIHAALTNQTGRPHPLMPFVGPAFAIDPTGRRIAATRTARQQTLIVDLPTIEI